MARSPGLSPSLPLSVFALIGNAPELAFHELEAVTKRLGQAPPTKTPNPRLVKLVLSPDTPAQLQSVLGGVIKLYTPLSEVSPTPEAVCAYLIAHGLHRLAFSSFSPPPKLRHFVHSLKQIAKAQDYPLSYRLLSAPTESAGITTTFPELCMPFDQDFPVLRSLTVQDIDWWSFKDYQRPLRYPQKGMLPPKIARSMLNCALPSPITPHTVVMDPFCGVGTILMEAIELGCQVQGSDIDAQMLSAAQANLDWFVAQLPTSPAHSFTLTRADAQRPLAHIQPSSLDAIVFEGYLGPRYPQPQKFPDYIRGLNAMYLGVFKHLRPLLKPQARLCAAIPSFVSAGHVKTLKRLIDRCENLGYTPVSNDLWYARRQAVVRRHLLIWQKN